MIKNNEWRSWLMLAPEGTGGGSSTGSDEGTVGTGQSEGGDPAGSDEGSGEKTFTQDQVNSMIAAEKRKNMSSMYKGLGFESEDQAKEFVKKYKEQEEQNKSELTKAQEQAKQFEAEKNAEKAKAQDLQYKFDAMSEGCSAGSADDVIVLAKAKMSDDKDFAAALKEVKEQYPSMFGQTDEGNGGSTGGGGTLPRGKLKSGDISGLGKRLAEQRKQNNTTKDSEFFK